MTNNEYIYGLLKTGFDTDFVFLDVISSVDDIIKTDNTCYLNLDNEKISQLDTEMSISQQKVDMTFELFVGYKVGLDVAREGLFRQRTNEIIDIVKKRVFNLNVQRTQINGTLRIRVNEVCLTDIYKQADLINNTGFIIFTGIIEFYEGI